MNKYINYDFGNKPDDYLIINFPYFASDIIKILYLLKNKNITIR